MPVILNGDPIDKIDVVFVGSGFPDLNTFAAVIDDMIDANNTRTGLMHYEPFNSNKSGFNFWKVNSLQTFNGGTTQVGPIWTNSYAYHDESRDLVINGCGSINQVPTPLYITLMVNPRIRAHADANPFRNTTNGAAYITVGNEYLNNGPWPIIVQNDTSIFDDPVEVGNSMIEVQRAVVHEFGHSFGALADEYEFGIIGLGGAGLMPNCDDNFSGMACSKWASVCVDCCKAICSYQNFYRAYDNTIMNWTFANYDVNFMPVNERELEADINAYLLLPESTPTESDLSYLVNVNYNNGNLTLNEIGIIEQQTGVPTESPESDYELVVKSQDDLNLFQFDLTFPRYSVYVAPKNWFDANGTQSFTPDVDQIVSHDDVNLSFTVPYFSNGKAMKIYDENSILKLSIDLQQFATRLTYSIGSGSSIASSTNYEVQYALTGQPTGKISSASYTCEIGPVSYTN